MSKYFPERVWPRLVPKGSIMVSLFAPDGSQAYGVIGNISEGGAQVVAGVHIESGNRVLLRIGFDPEQPFATSGVVVWSRDASDDKHNSFVHGIQFVIDDPEQRERLRAILSDPQFVQPVVPGLEPTSDNLTNMMDDLGDELGKLGERIQEES